MRESEMISSYMFNSLSHFLYKNCNFQKSQKIWSSKLNYYDFISHDYKT